MTQTCNFDEQWSACDSFIPVNENYWKLLKLGLFFTQTYNFGKLWSTLDNFIPVNENFLKKLKLDQFWKFWIKPVLTLQFWRTVEFTWPFIPVDKNFWKFWIRLVLTQPWNKAYPDLKPANFWSNVDRGTYKPYTWPSL